MVENLLAKTPESCQFYLFDVFAKPVEDLCKKYPNRVHQCQSSKEVADKSVCMKINRDSLKDEAKRNIENHNLHGTRRISRPISVLDTRLWSPSE